jgi:DNA polymerase bacteriophage-type
VAAVTAHVDFETKSAVDLKKTGVYVYAEDPTTDIWCMAWAIGDEPVELWLPGDPIPEKFAFYVESGGTITAHNAAFERIIWKYILTPRYGFPEPELEQFRCTMAMGLAMALPGSLGQLGEALKVDQKKDEAGARLMLQMAKPRSKKGAELTWWDLPEKKERLFAYCKQDVETERAIEKRLRPLTDFEQKLWFLDQQINDRGLAVDLDLCNKSNRIVDSLKEDLDARMSKLTEFDVTGCQNHAQFGAWLRSKGIPAESVAKDVLADLLMDADLDPTVRAAIMVRQEGAKAATSKIDALVRGTSPDGRSKGLLQYHGTVTGRWGGRRFQPQNIRRNKIKDTDTLIKALSSGDPALLTMLYDRPLDAVGDGIRGMVIAAKGKRLIAADFSNIEGRVAAWYAGEAWKVKAFGEFDAGIGPDLYKVAYSRSFGTTVESVQDEQRQIGKVMELSLQYQGGHGAFVAMAAGYGVEPDKITPIVKKAVGEMEYDYDLNEVPSGVFAKALKRYRPQFGFGMKPETWAALRVLIDGWRAAHPNIVQAWKDLEAAAMSAIEAPGHVFSVGAVKFKKKGSFLWMQIPSGRNICFPYPKIKEKLMPWTETKIVDGQETEVEVYKPSLCYMGIDSFTKQWGEQFSYGGALFDYVVQGTARDIMAEAMFRVEEAGYPIVLTVHDEIVSEPLKGHGSLDEFKALMATVPSWAAGCPISASGWSGFRYRKG